MCSDRSQPSKEEWLEEAARAYERAFGDRDRKRVRPPTFSELEEEACEEGDRLSRWLLERKLAGEAAVGQPGAQPCPHCGKLCEPRSDDAEPRQVESRRGTVSISRHSFECSSCRRVFFPSGPSAGPAEREL